MAHRTAPSIVKRTLAGAAAVLLLGVAACGTSSSVNSPGPRAAAGCLDAWKAISEVMNGTRSAESAITTMDAAASTVRAAADKDAKYAPIAQWIVGAEAELRSGGPGKNAGELYAECGPGRPSH